jgi:hypothetical protein
LFNVQNKPSEYAGGGQGRHERPEEWHPQIDQMRDRGSLIYVYKMISTVKKEKEKEKEPGA